MSGDLRVPVFVSGKNLGEVSVSTLAPAGSRTAAIMAHGAGGNMHTRSIVELQARLAKEGLAAVRFNFLYTEARRRAPDRAPALEACWRAVADWARAELAPSFLFLGGRSMGGRIASHLGAQGYPAAGFFFLGYPLHPPRQENRLRKEHLADVRAPMLFISGSRDPLARLELLRDALAPLGDRARLHVVEGGDHSLRVSRAQAESGDVSEEVVGVLLDFFRTVAAA